MSGDYKFQGKCYLKTIKCCEGIGKRGDCFTLCCKIPGRGNKEYSFIRGTDFLQRNGRKVWLAGENLQRVSKEAERFESNCEIALGEKKGFARAVFDDVDLFFRIRDEEHYEVYREDRKNGQVVLFPLLSVKELIRLSGKESECNRDHPLYRSALKSGNQYLCWQMEKLFAPAPRKKAAVCKRKILPVVGEEMNREFCLEQEKIAVKSFAESGYEVYHRPYFAMGGMTHSRMTVNPWKRKVADAAPIDAIPMSWEEFVRMLENEANERNG